MWLRATVFLALTLVAAAQAPSDGRDEKAAPLHASLEPLLEEALGGVGGPGAVDELYRACVLEHGTAAPLVARLAERRAADGVDGPQRLAILRVEGLVRRREGDLEGAKESFRAITISEAGAASAEAWEQLAEVLDARGELAEASGTYSKLLELTTDPETVGRARLRLALLRRAGPRSAEAAPLAADPLVDFALGADRKLRNRAAIVLGVLGQPDDAVGLFVVDGEGSARLRQEVRMAEWALAGGDPVRARRHSWRALRAATLDRDRRFALAVLVEAHRADDTLDELVRRLASEDDLPEVARKVWIDLLRELGRVDDALRLFRDGGRGDFTAAMRRELLEMCREAGAEAELVAAYTELMAREPTRIEWREGLARHYLERGRVDEARALWQPLLGASGVEALACAEALMALGLDDDAVAFAERALERPESAARAGLFLCHLHRNRGRMERAEQALETLAKRLPAAARERMQLAEAFERVGRKRRAIEVLEALREARGSAAAAEDLDMRLAWLYSEVGEEEKALARWRELWGRVASVARRRYVADRLLNVAARTGALADIAIDLEEKIFAGEGDDRDRALLVHLYTKANDAVSAAEIIQEFGKRGGDPVASLQESARVYLSCHDYRSYERTVKKLLRADPEGAPDYLRQLAMSALERARPKEARKVLARLKELERGADGAEFEAGVLALAGLHEDAIGCYRRGLVAHPERIEAWLLLGGVMSRCGKKDRAIGLFQHLAETAAKDDLFTVAIDGLLNLQAPRPVLEWARRVTMARLAGRHDKMYLYQLVADLSEELNDRDTMLLALESSLPVAGEQRAAVLREMMELAGAAGGGEKLLRYGRRLLGLGDVVPPDVYLNLGEAFLEAGDVASAARTFALATDVPDYQAFQRRIAATFEKSDFKEEALRIYERALIGQAGDVELIAKVAELHEELGRDAVALPLYERALDLMFSRRPLSTAKEQERPQTTSFGFTLHAGGSNLDAYDQFYDRILPGFLATLPDEAALEACMAHECELIEADVASAEAEAQDDRSTFTLRRYPRLHDRAAHVRRSCLAFGRPGPADDLDARLLAVFAEDETLLDELVEERLTWGFVASARRLIDASGRPAELKDRARFLAGAGGQEGAVPGSISAAAASRLFLPLLLDGRVEEARDLLHRIELPAIAEDDLESMPLLVAVASYLSDPDASLTFSRRWIGAAAKFRKNYRIRSEADKALDAAWPDLEREHRRSLADAMIALLLEDPKKHATLTNLISNLQRHFEQPLMRTAQVKDLLKKGLTGSFYTWAGLLKVVSAGDRLSVVEELFPKVPAARRASFLLDVLAGLDVPIGEELERFILARFETSLKAVKSPLYSYALRRSLHANEHNPRLALALARLLEKKDADNADYAVALAAALRQVGDDDAAREKGRVAFRAVLERGKSDWKALGVVRQLIQVFGQREARELTRAIDVWEEEKGATAVTATLRVVVLERLEDTAGRLDFLRGAVRRFPDTADLANRYRNLLRQTGHRAEAVRILAKVVRLQPKRGWLKASLEREWEQLRHPLHARQARAAQPGKAGGRRSAARKTPRPTIGRVKHLLARGDTEEARRTFRSLWRKFGRRTSFSPWRPIQYEWPGDGADGSEGGLPPLDRDEPDEDRNAFLALAEQEWGEAESMRLLRCVPGSRLDAAVNLFAGLARTRVERDGAEAAQRGLLQRVRSGVAGKTDCALLLRALESDPGALGDEAARVLRELSTTIRPDDGAQIRRLAYLYARTGHDGEAARLYRWCAPFTTARFRAFWMARTASVGDLIDEVCGVLHGARRDEVVEAVLRAAAPGPTTRDGGRRAALVLATWSRVLGPQETRRRFGTVVDSAAVAGEEGLNRPLARAAAAVLARCGDLEGALTCLEAAVCARDGDHAPLLSAREIAELVPPAEDAWPAAEWYARVAREVAAWAADDRMLRRHAARLRTVVAVRLSRCGEVAAARAILDELSRMPLAYADDRLWVADAARLTGDGETALRIERELLDDSCLHVARIPRVVRAIAERETPESALEVGERAADYTLHPELLAQLIAMAELCGKDERAAYWKSIKKQIEEM